MRLLPLLLLAACASDVVMADPEHGFPTPTYKGQHHREQHYSAMYEGSFSVDAETGGFVGTENTTVTAEDGTVDCGLGWQTTADVGVRAEAAPCPDCDVAWDVTCDQGIIEQGDSCNSWFDRSYYQTPQEFGMAFHEIEERDGVPFGMVMFSERPGFDGGWYMGGYATFDGTNLSWWHEQAI